MSETTSRRPRWPAAVGIAVAAFAIGSVAAVPGSGHAAGAAAPSNTATPTISGTPQDGSTLTASTGTWSNSPTSYTYSWSRCDKNGDTCAAITAATASTYKLQSADVGGTLRVTVTATNADGAAAATSAPTAVVAAASAPANTATPTIAGTPQEGSTLTASNGTWTGSPTGYAYVWNRCDRNGDNCAAVSGASASTYKLQAADVGNTLRVTVTATNSAGSTQATSAPSAAVAGVGAPTNTAPPTIAGAVQLGSTLTASTGSWSGSPAGYAYAWSRCDTTGGSCAAIGGANAHTYQLKQVDVGSTLRVSVTATNSGGSTTATSVPTAVVPAPPATVVNGCPTGSGAIQAAQVSPPARLQIDGQAMTPGLATLSTAMLQVRVRVTACGGRPVQGALVYATAVPYNQFSIPPEAGTGADGYATLTMSRLGGFPAARHQQLLAMLIRARKAGEPLLGGVSTRRLVSFPVSLRG